MEIARVAWLIILVFIMTCLLCWVAVSDSWIFGPFMDVIVFIVGVTLIGLFGFASIEDRSSR